MADAEAWVKEPSEAGAPEAQAVILRPYLLVSHLPCVVDALGGVRVDRLWAIDLTEHLHFVRSLTLAAPLLEPGDRPGFVPVEVPPESELKLVALPRMGSAAEVLRGLPRLVATLWSAVGRAGLVHSSFGGWPLPLAWLAIPMARLRGRRSVAVMESAPWRPTGEGRVGLRGWLRWRVSEALARLLLPWADLSIFHQGSWREAFLGRARARGLVIPASWIQDEDLRPEAAARADWQARRARAVPRVLFAARMTRAKGVEVLAEALRMLEARGVELEVKVIGRGPQREVLADLQPRQRHARVECLEPVAYGEPFFSLVRSCDAVVVPSLSDEQPRLVFDAFAQAVPLLASDTDGLREHVTPGRTGWLAPPGDAGALADALEALASDRDALPALGLAGLAYARDFTQRAVHRRRWSRIAELAAAEGR